MGEECHRCQVCGSGCRLQQEPGRYCPHCKVTKTSGKMKATKDSCAQVSSGEADSLGMFSTLPMRCSMRSTASFAPPCKGPYRAPTAPDTAVYTSTPLHSAHARTATAQQQEHQQRHKILAETEANTSCALQHAIQRPATAPESLAKPYTRQVPASCC